MAWNGTRDAAAAEPRPRQEARRAEAKALKQAAAVVLAAEAVLNARSTTMGMPIRLATPAVVKATRDARWTDRSTVTGPRPAVTGPTPGLTPPRGVPGVGPTPGLTHLATCPGYQLTVSPG